METVKIHIAIKKEIYELLEKACDETSRSKSDYIAYAVREQAKRDGVAG